MPSLSRALLVAVHAAALALLVGSPEVAMVSATPIPTPMPLVASFAEYVKRSDLAARLQDMTLPVHDYTVSTTKSSTPTFERRQMDSSILDNMGILNNYWVQLNNNAGTMNTLAQQASSQQDNADYQQQCLSTLSAFHTNLLGFQTTLASLAADKGLANYDKTDDMETLQMPALGPVLGPIVYDVKCILDDMMDAVENMTDAILNMIAPLLQALIGQATQTACDSGIQLAGLCVDLR